MVKQESKDFAHGPILPDFPSQSRAYRRSRAGVLDCRRRKGQGISCPGVDAECNKGHQRGGGTKPRKAYFEPVRPTLSAAFICFDTAHVLDTGGFDLTCRGNESLQWRGIATTGIANPIGQLTLSPPSTSASGGAPVTSTAQVTDAAGAGLANVAVDFKVLSGPNAGQSGEISSDSQGHAQFTYTGSNQGTDGASFRYQCQQRHVPIEPSHGQLANGIVQFLNKSAIRNCNAGLHRRDRGRIQRIVVVSAVWRLRSGPSR